MLRWWVVRMMVSLVRAVHGDFRMGGDESPPIGGGPVGGDTCPMGGDSRVIRDNIVA